ncbi:MAG: phosphatase PAP2 family protein [Chitinophagaceae bacterium]|nr:MAG: phosphatase PAP2 family protein [Chitinophagaceae bacterium]
MLHNTPPIWAVYTADSRFSSLWSPYCADWFPSMLTQLPHPSSMPREWWLRLLLGLSTHFVKQAEHRLRPNGSAYNSFPSGHTASAFAAAEFLKQEYKDVSPWYGYAGYFLATATGTLRMYNNKHWFSDVVAGAGFGIASTKISYFVYPYIRRLFAEKKTQNFTVVPFHQDGTNGLMLYGRF